MTGILPLFIVCWSFLVVEFVKIFPFFKKIFKSIFIVYILHESTHIIYYQLTYNTGNIEIYNLLHGRSPLLLDYSDYISEQKAIGNKVDFDGFDRVESFFVNDKYESPITSWAHVPSSEGNKITALFPAF